MPLSLVLPACCSCRGDGSDMFGDEDAHGMSRMSLRFRSRLAEDGFLRMQTDRLDGTSRIFFGVVAGLAFLQGLFVLIGPGLKASKDEAASSTQVVLHMQLFLMFGLCGASLLCMSLMRLLKALKSPTFLYEPTFCCCSIILLMAGLMTDKYYLTRILGYEASIWASSPQGAYFSDTRVLLAIDACITVTHLVVPIRWCMLVAIEVSSALMYISFAWGIGSPEANMAQFNIALLLFLTCTSAVGKRSVERSERRAFAEIARERMLRAEAQFAVARMNSGKPRQTATQMSASEDGSASVGPSTSPTETIFNIDPTAEMTTQLAQISAIGMKEHWLLELSDLRLAPNRVLGAGAFGLVLMGMYRGMPVAVKVPREMEDVSLSRRQFISLANELRILRHLRHPNIVLFYGAVVIERPSVGVGVLGPGSSDYLVLVLERVDGITLDAYIENSEQDGVLKKLPGERERFLVLLGMARALQYLHTLHPTIVHGDLKPSNVLIEVLLTGPRAKLVDFGLSRVLTRRPRPLGGTALWMAPEVLRQVKPNAAADMFSFGRMIFFLLTGQLPFQGLMRDQINSIVKCGAVPATPWAEGEDSPLIAHCKPIVDSCVSVDAGARPKAFEVLLGLETFSMENFREKEGEICTDETMEFHFAVTTATALLRQQGNRWNLAKLFNQRSGKAPTPQPAVGLNKRPPSGGSGRALEAVTEGEEKNEDLVAPPPPSPGADKDFRTTLKKTRELCIMMMILEWNVELPPQTCCKYHATVAVLAAHCKEFLRQHPCKLEFLSPGNKHRQCPACLLLIAKADGARCGFCDSSEARIMQL